MNLWRLSKHASEVIFTTAYNQFAIKASKKWIHASYVINMKHVSKFTRGDGGYVVMSNNQHIIVSRKKKDQFFEMFLKT